MSSEKILKKFQNGSTLFRDFTKHFMAGLQVEEFEEHAPDVIARMLEEAWEAGKKRSAGEVLIHAHVVPGAKKGWLHEKTRIVVVSPDRAFIIDSVTAALHTRNLTIRTLMHPMLSVTRDGRGNITAVSPRSEKPAKGAENESWLVIEVRGAVGAAQCRELEKQLTSVMSDVLSTTRDWQKMRGELQNAIAEMDAHRHQKVGSKSNHETLDEYVAFLQYLHDNNFTLLGYREYEFTGSEKDIGSKILKGESLGLFSDDNLPVYKNKSSVPLPQDLQRLRKTAPLLSVYKVNRRSTVHRAVPMDVIALKTFDKQGNVRGEKLFIGLFTSVTYSRSVYDVPLLRRKVRQVIADIKFAPGSHDFRALAHILEKYPRDELFQMPVEQIRSHMIGILRLQDRPRVALYPRVDPFRRYVSCLVYVPRERYGTALRTTIQEILERELDGYCENFYTTLDDSPLARVIFVIATDQRLQRTHDFRAVERKLVAASRMWSERLREAIMEATPDERRAISLSLEYDDAFPVSYQDYYPPEEGVCDILKIEEAIHNHRIALNLYQVPQDGADSYRLKLYHPRHAVSLSEALPILENMGFTVDAEFPFEITPQEGGRLVWVQEFHLRLKSGVAAGKLTDIKSQLETALMAIWYGQAESDALNGLILMSGLEWRDIVVLRSYVKYMQQAAVPYSPAYVMQALIDYPVLAGALVGLFHARHDPAIPDAKRNIKKWNDAILQGLESVDRLDQDRIIRFIKSLVDATLRTNFYQTDENGLPKPWLSFKLDSASVAALPDPRPWREIWVYSPRMEGIHLRGGKIARGGIRWSDRTEDFRTEILGLMQAQMVKNAIIVPEGAKGGFIVKKPPVSGERAAMQAEAIECYRTLVRGMLDITDNRAGNKIMHPAKVVRHDEDDPYLVVAADKGTATFSDIANALSQEYGFWLDDAFASGGSAGYDHKEIGITARGAWECIKRHFRELGNDIQTDDFNVIGVGDMAGDVFGNGMLLSKHIRLIGAFNHMHIFCDPNPDAAATWKERNRLFRAVRGWGDYDQKLLSKGGRIFLRSEKSLQLTPEIRKAFGIDAEKLSPAELIQAMLKASCDLLYFGGIGTYIKGSQQTDAEAGDRANDALRVNASDINARVVGEGANLAVTRRARIELGQRGIKLNADFVDNSGGVDCSDHEVNIKILLQQLTEGSKPVLTLKARNKLLEDMTEEVAGLVLRDSYLQSQAISLSELDGPAALSTQSRFIELMEREDGLKRKVEGLPSPQEFEQFNLNQQGLTRPVLATLVSLSKLRLYKTLMATNLPDDPLAEIWLMDYFPTPLRKNYQAAIRKHRLRREIIAKQMTASLINRLGPTFMMTMMDKTGASVADIARAVFIAREAFALRPLWYAIEAMDGRVPAMVQLKSMKQIARLIEYLTLWFLRHGREMVSDGSLSKSVDRLQASVAVLRTTFKDTLPDSRLLRINAHRDAAIESGLPRDIALNMAYLNPLRSAPDIIRIAGGDLKKLDMTATLFFHIGDQLHFDWLRAQARLLSGSSFWQAEAIDGVIGQLYTAQAHLTRSILGTPAKDKDALGRLESWRRKNAETLAQFESLLADMRRLPQLDLAMLTLAEQRLRQLGA